MINNLAMINKYFNNIIFNKFYEYEYAFMGVNFKLHIESHDIRIV